MQGTLLVVWEKGYEERLAVVTDLLPAQAQAAWYQMRFWVEDEYKDHQRGGFHWEQTKMRDPARAERLYLVMAVAMQLALVVGGWMEAQEEQPRKRNHPSTKKRKRRRGRPARTLGCRRGREQSCLERGYQAISAAALRAEEIPVGYLVAEPWPNGRPSVGRSVSSWVKRRKRQRPSQAEQRRQVQAARRTHRQEQARQRQRRKAEREAERQWKDQHRAERRRWHEECQHAQQEKQVARLQRRQDRENQQEERKRWHKEMARDRQRRLARSQARAERRARATPSSHPSVSHKLTDPVVIGPPAQPP